jgi:hypothetical protein
LLCQEIFSASKHDVWVARSAKIMMMISYFLQKSEAKKMKFFEANLLKHYNLEPFDHLTF